jgi:Tol biopolymer transport system component
VNTKHHENCPIISPDGRYLFFNSGRNGKSDIYWVDAKIIEEFIPKESK